MSENQGPKRSRSVKHHYLPRYYLRGFGNADNLLFVYDKREDRFLPKPLTSDALFFENNLNTVTLSSGEQSDFLEELYASIENTFWESFDKIRQSSAEHAIGLWDKIHLFHFLLFLHWRLPSNASNVEELTKSLFKEGSDLSFVRLENQSGKDAHEDIRSEMRESPEFAKAARLIAPFAPFYEVNWIEQLRNWRFFYTGDAANWYLVGDNPIVTRGTNDHEPKRCLDEFIFPVAGSIIVATSNQPIRKELSPEVIIQFGSAIVMRARRFVACGRRDFLEAIVEDYKRHVCYHQENQIVGRLFTMLSG